MLIKNTDHRYGIVTILLHWIMAIIIIGLLILGLYMVREPLGLFKLKLYGWHKEFGLLILALVVVRISWRIINISPVLPEDIPYWQRLAARLVHLAFYVFMIFMPLTGWLMSSAAGVSVSFFGLFVLPDLISPNQDFFHLFREIHEWLAYGLIATIVLHVGAALKHLLIHRDNIMRRMLWP